jgi:hypothetical protein
MFKKKIYLNLNRYDFIILIFIILNNIVNIELTNIVSSKLLKVRSPPFNLKIMKLQEIYPKNNFRDNYIFSPSTTGHCQHATTN